MAEQAAGIAESTERECHVYCAIIHLSLISRGPSCLAKQLVPAWLQKGLPTEDLEVESVS